MSRLASAVVRGSQCAVVVGTKSSQQHALVLPSFPPRRVARTTYLNSPQNIVNQLLLVHGYDDAENNNNKKTVTRGEKPLDSTRVRLTRSAAPDSSKTPRARPPSKP